VLAEIGGQVRREPVFDVTTYVAAEIVSDRWRAQAVSRHA